uniref:Uncharacterized protein n=1 Tax=Opuntia streptacantha TaxID=393608 RepID=A0A7C9EU61_OPUST
MSEIFCVVLAEIDHVFGLKLLGNETFEKLGTIGTLSNLLVYLTTVFNMSTISATMLITVFNGTTNFATLLGAFLCDTYFGRYNTLGFATVASFLVTFFLSLLIFEVNMAIPVLQLCMPRMTLANLCSQNCPFSETCFQFELKVPMPDPC